MELTLVGCRMRVTVERERKLPSAPMPPSEQVVARKHLIEQVEKQREEMQIRLGGASYFRVG